MTTHDLSYAKKQNTGFDLLCLGLYKYHISNKFEESVNRIPRTHDSKGGTNVTKSFHYKVP